MTNLLRWTVVAVATLHGLIHLLGAAERFGWADDPTLEKSAGLGFLWLAAAVLLFAAALFAALGAAWWWWALALTAAVTSQAAILTSWEVSRSGTMVNLFLLLVAIYSFLLRGPVSFHSRWRKQATEALAAVEQHPAPLTEADLAGLPDLVATYVRRSGAVGRPRPTSVHATFHGRIRNGPDARWMPFTGRQLNTFGENPRRLFIMDASRSGVPITVLHCYGKATATMRAKVMSMFTVVDASGPEMDLGEMVTVFNDLVVLAPGAIPGAPITWTQVSVRQVEGVFTNDDQQVSAVLTFDGDHLVNFVSQDRPRASAGGKSFTRQTWSTPVAGHTEADGRHVITSGVGRWHDPRGWFTYVELEFDEIRHNVDGVDSVEPVGAHQERLRV